MFKFKQKYLCVLFVVMMFFVVASGGCGGGSSNSSSRSNQSNPNNPNNPETEYDIRVLSGTWKASNGTGTASGSGITAETRMNTGYSSTVLFSNVQVNGNSASINAESQIYWDALAYDDANNEYYLLYSDLHDDFGGSSTLTFQHTGKNTWLMTRTRSDGPESTTITLTSSTTANVVRDGYYSNDDGVFHYQLSYTITKQNTPSPDPETEYDISVLVGTWVASNGTATMTASDENFSLVMEKDGGSISFSNIQINGDIASIDMEGETYWEYQNGSRIGSGHREGFSRRTREFQRVGKNTWQRINAEPLYPGAPEVILRITITSPTTAELEDESNFYDEDRGAYGRWKAHYTLTKQSTPSPDPETKYDFTILEGTWKASNCTGTITSGDLIAELSLSTNHSNTITFTNVSASGNTGTFEGTSDIYLDIAGYPNQWEDEFGGGNMSSIGGYEYQNTSGNTWNMQRLNHHDNKPVGVTITFTSETTAEVEQYVETDDVIVEYSYTLTKQQ